MIIESPNFFKGKKLAAYLRKCEIHENGLECYLTNLETITKLVCVQPQVKGNSIKKVDDLVSGRG